MRNAEELSTTTAPAATAIGANFLEIELPALKSAMSMPSKLLSVGASTSSVDPAKGRAFPAERAEANSLRRERGKRRRSRQPISSIPPAPVAPTMATVGFACDMSHLLEAQK